MMVQVDLCVHEYIRDNKSIASKIKFRPKLCNNVSINHVYNIPKRENGNKNFHLSCYAKECTVY